MTPLTILFIVVVLYLIKLLKRDALARIPGPIRLPLIGNLVELDFHRAHISIERLMKEYGDIYRIYLYTKPVVVVSSRKGIHELLVKKGKQFSGRVDYIRYKKHTGGYFDVSFTDSQKPGWHELKKFIIHHMKGFGGGFKVIETVTVDIVNEMLLEMEKKTDTPFNLVNDITRGLTTIVYMMAFEFKDIESGDLSKLMLRDGKFPVHATSERLECENERQFIMQVSKLINLPTEVGGSAELLDIMPWLRHFGHPAWKALEEAEKKKWLLYRSWKDRVMEHKQEGKDVSQNAIIKLLSMVEKWPNWFTEDMVVVITWELFFAGTLTTTGVLGTLFHLLIDNPDIQEKLHDEIVEVIGDNEITFEERQKMPYTMATIFETLRIAPVVPLLAPHKALETTTIMGYTIPKGTEVWPNVWGMQHDEGIWGEDALKFKPERYLEDGSLVDADHMARMCNLTFGAGPRVCAGETFAMTRIFFILSKMIQRFELVAPDNQEKLDINDLESGDVLMAPPYQVILRKRKIIS